MVYKKELIIHFLLSHATTSNNFGSCVALSNSGDTLIVGAPADSSAVGAVWAYQRNGNGLHTLMCSKITGTGNVGASN